MTGIKIREIECYFGFASPRLNRFLHDFLDFHFHVKRFRARVSWPHVRSAVLGIVERVVGRWMRRVAEEEEEAAGTFPATVVLRIHEKMVRLNHEVAEGAVSN